MEAAVGMFLVTKGGCLIDGGAPIPPKKSNQIIVISFTNVKIN